MASFTPSRTNGKAACPYCRAPGVAFFTVPQTTTRMPSREDVRWECGACGTVGLILPRYRDASRDLPRKRTAQETADLASVGLSDYSEPEVTTDNPMPEWLYK